MVDVGFIAPLSNFEGKGPAPVGTYQGMTCRGIYDMAGNVKEWCFNKTPEGGRIIAGGGWNETSCMFGADEKPPFVRDASFGFRCMKLLSDDDVWKRAGASVRWRPPFVVGDQKPCSDEAFQIIRRLYDYNKSELQPTIEATEDVSVSTRRERVSFNAAYGNERMIAYLYLPRTSKPPFQTEVYFPAGIVFMLDSIDKAPKSPKIIDQINTRSGRAFVVPVLRGAFERKIPPEKQGNTTESENGIMWAKDYRRTLDYLETRPKDFDMNKVAFVGASSGAWWGGILPAIEPRIKVAIMEGGGFWPNAGSFSFPAAPYPPEYSQVNFAPRIKIPILLQGGRYDTFFPVEENQKPFLKLFGTAEQDRQLKLYETAHALWSMNEPIQDERAFLDQYFGSAK
ncbi:MAG: SUMF1/EgtB/PvdO family nonheme iron enzyme [Verrucomicrobia bacterium]|nr:SUMF1/EgtB/PvdO family nonheme iron enzyme [Verrucomicrobiota bacterium]